MSSKSAHQQSLADAGSETRPPILERGPYKFKKIQPELDKPERDQIEDDLTDSCQNARDMWLQYVTSVRLAKNVKDEPYDVLFDYFQQYEKLVIASRVKIAAKTHDPLALAAYTSSSSSRSPPPYYVTHPPFVVDYDDDY
ncbi:hypothetical protein Tco_1421385 [Tanacetum coccineum]